MSKIIIFGAGVMGKRYASDPFIKNDIVAFVDNNKDLWDRVCYDKPVISLDKLEDLEYDYIIIAIKNQQIVSDIRKQLISAGINESKILCLNDCPEIIVWEQNDIGKSFLTFYNFESKISLFVNNDIKESTYYGIPVISPNEFFNIPYWGSLLVATDNECYINIKQQLISRGIPEEKIRYCGDFMKYHESSARFLYMKNFAKWINEQNLEGSVAECGVNTGDSAKFINEYFPNRKLYLFDTFEGFAEQDIKAEQKLNNDEFLNGQFNKVGLFSGTEEDFVMKKMTYPENVIIKKGYFPDSAEDINDKFCFVNLDMDLYQPMLAALHFFWDKVIEGGCIVLHDYFHPKLPGVAQAVADFEKERNIKLHKTVIGDDCSIAILK